MPGHYQLPTEVHELQYGGSKRYCVDWEHLGDLRSEVVPGVEKVLREQDVEYIVYLYERG